MRAQASLIGLASLLLACDLNPEPHSPNAGEIVFHRSGSAAADPQRVLAPFLVPPAVADPEQRDILDRISTDPAAFFGRNPPAPVLNEAELVYFAAGRTFELADHYRAAVDAGVTALRPRLAWTYQRLGLDSAALAQAQRAVDEQPSSADAWFVLGFTLGQSETADDALLSRVRDAYAKALELDDAYVGPSGVSAADLAEQVRRIDAALAR